MNDLFLLLFLVSTLGLILGMISPKIVILWGAKRTRLQVLYSYGIAAVVFLVLLNIAYVPTARKATITSKKRSATNETKNYVEAQTAKPEVVYYRIIDTKNDFAVEGEVLIRIPFIIKNMSKKPIGLSTTHVQGIKNGIAVFELIDPQPIPEWIKPGEISYAMVSTIAKKESLQGIKLDFYVDATILEERPKMQYEVLGDKVSGNEVMYEYKVLEDVASGRFKYCDGFAFFDKEGNLIEVVGGSIEGPKKRGIVYSNSYTNYEDYSNYIRVPSKHY